MTMNEKVWKVGAVKTGEKCCSRAANEGVSSMSRLPLLGVGCPESVPDSLPIPGAEADIKSRAGSREGRAKAAA